MLLHLLVSVAATFVFTVALYWLVAPQCRFAPLFGVFLLVYLSCSGLGFWTSVWLSPALSGIIGILGVLSFVLFGGKLFANEGEYDIDQQTKDLCLRLEVKELGFLQKFVVQKKIQVAFPPVEYPLALVFWGLSLLSPMRWSYGELEKTRTTSHSHTRAINFLFLLELVVLVIMEPYRMYLKDKELTYLYTLWGFSYSHLDQAWVALALLCFLLRVLPYVAMVRQERK